MATRDIRINGMNCQHCVMAVRKELAAIPTVKVGDVKIGMASIEYDDTKVTLETVLAAIEKAGYAVA